jgi:hypothetical protein
MPRVEFEPTIPVFQRAKTVHALDRVAGHCDRLQCILGLQNDLFNSGFGANV